MSLIKRAFKANIDLNEIDGGVGSAFGFFHFAGFGAIVVEADGNALNRPTLAAGIHLYCHDFARRQRTEQQRIGIWSRVVAAAAKRFISVDVKFVVG